MTLSLYQRLSFALLAVFVTVTLVFILWWQHVEKQTRQESKQRLHLSLAASLARDNPLLQQGVYDHQALKNLFHTLMILGPAFEFYYLDPEGNILTYSVNSSSVKRKKIDLTPIHSLNQNKAPLPIYGDDPKHLSRKKIFSAAPVFNGMDLQGFLYVIVEGERYLNAFENLQNNNRMQASILFIVAALVFLFFVMLWLFRYITQPIRRLTKQMKTFEQANFDFSAVQFTDFSQAQSNEVAVLNCVFKEMAQRINDQLAQLNQVDNKRRELLTEISHDLRTPLATAKGYIETIALQGDNLSSDKRQAYVETALKSASQLNNLIDQVFELAHLEDGKITINLETFNLTEVLYDIIARYSIKASQADITMSIKGEDESAYVYSDIGKLERILSNLIDNALRHTPAGGKVELLVHHVCEEQIQLSVADSGTGIKQEEIAYIFDARYRASNATSGKHSGLGLAISKKLAELLKTDLKVSSQLGKGSQFSFNLRKASL